MNVIDIKEVIGMATVISSAKTEVAEVKEREANDVEVHKEMGEGIEREAVIRRESELKGKEAVLAVLARAADDEKFLARLADNPAEALEEYYTLTQEEKAALASGDLRKIESWVGKLDQRLAKWLWCRLSQEKW